MANMCLASIMSLVLWTYATGKRRLVDDDIDPGLVRRQKIIHFFPLVIVCPIAVGVSFVNPIAAYAVFYLGGVFVIVAIIRG